MTSKIKSIQSFMVTAVVLSKTCFQKTAYQENKNIQGKNEQEKQQQTVFFFRRATTRNIF